MDSSSIFDSRDAWLDARKSGIGASDAAAVLGVSQWRGPLQVYCDKLGIAQTDPAEVEAMEWGLALETPIAARYQRETGRTVIDPGPFTIHRSPEHPFMLATVDRFIDTPDRGRGVLEIKTTGGFRGEWDTDAPLPYQIQIMHQMAVTGLAWGSLAVLVGGQKFLWMDVERNDEFIAALVEREREFWQRVQDQNPPPPDASESCRELLKRLYPREAPGQVIALPPDAAKWDAQRREAKAAMDVASASCREAENLLIAALGEAEVGLLPDGTRYSYKSQNRKGYTVEPATFRVLRRSEPK
jgi:putative phage-type endonuclease